jgi:hypothetical protein
VRRHPVSVKGNKGRFSLAGLECCYLLGKGKIENFAIKCPKATPEVRLRTKFDEEKAALEEKEEESKRIAVIHCK